MKKKIVGVLTVLCGLIASPVFAQALINEETAVGVGLTNGAVEIIGEGETSAESETSMEAESDSGSSVIKIESETQVGTKNSDDDEDEMEDEDQNEEDEDNDSSINISITSKNNTSAAKEVKTSSEVKNNEDLRFYASYIITANNSIDRVDSEKDEVEVTYKTNAKLFGFIPVVLKNKAEVTYNKSADASITSDVKIKQPWWRFITRASVKAQDTKTKIESDLNTKLQANVTTDAEVHAKILEVINTNVTSQTETSVSN